MSYPPQWGSAASTPSPKSTTTCWRFSVRSLNGRPGWSEGPDLRCAIAHRRTSRFRVRCYRIAPEWRLKSHRRGNSIAADIDAVGFQHAVFFLRRAEDDDLRARLHFGLVADHEGDDRCLRRHHDFLFAVLVLDQDVLAVGALDRFSDGGVGHRGIG